MYTKEYIYIYNTTSLSLSWAKWRGRGEGGRLGWGCRGWVEGEGGGNQLIMFNTCNTTQFWSEMECRHLHAVLGVHRYLFSVHNTDPSSTAWPSQRSALQSHILNDFREWTCMGSTVGWLENLVLQALQTMNYFFGDGSIDLCVHTPKNLLSLNDNFYWPMMKIEIVCLIEMYNFC